MAKPPALKAMVLGGVSEDGWRTDIHYLGGALYTAHVDWAGVMLMLNALPPDPAVFAGDWRAEWRLRLESNAPWIVPWLAHATHDSYWHEKSARISEAPPIPLLLYAGIADKYATSTLRISASWPGPVRTILGPWEHARPNVATRVPRIGYLQESLCWWDKFLKGHESGALDAPDLRLWLAAPDAKGEMAQGEWVAADPSAKAGAVLLFGLYAERLMRDAPPDEHPIRLSARPENPQSLSPDLYEDVPAPFDWRAARARGALVAFSEPLERDCDIGFTAVLAARCEATSGVVVARLLDVAPDGTAIRMTSGAANLAYVGQERLELPLQATSFRLLKDHRLALVLSADGWPTFWPARGVSELSLSSLSLSVPLVQRLPTAVSPFAPAVTHDLPRPQELKWINPENEPLPPAAMDVVSLHGRESALHIPSTGTDYFIATRFDLAAGGGEVASVAKFYHVAFERPDWSIRVETALEVSSTPTSFSIAWRIEAREGALVVHRTQRETEIPRATV
jgi:predicted acyl esterase